jgi:hypothetical protein
MGTGAKSVGAPRSLYRGLRPVALRALIWIAARVGMLSRARARAPLYVASTVEDLRFQRTTVGAVYPPAATGWSFAIERHYASSAQAEAFQSVLDRLASLNLIAWAREPATIEITVADDAASWRG